MNAAARALAEGSFEVNNIRAFALSSRNIFICLLTLAVLATAFTVVSVKDINRRLFNDLQSLQQTRDELQVEWGQLLLEQNTWATQARIQQIAQENMGMVVPSEQIIINAK